MSKFSTLELSFTSTIANLILTVKENKFCQTIIFKNCQRSQDATNLLRNFEFQKEFLELNDARAIIFEINDDLLDITIDEINKLKLNHDREIVIGFFNELLDRFKIFWKLKNTEFIWTSFDNVEANYNLNNCDISKVFRFIIDVLSNSIKKGLSAINSCCKNNENFFNLTQIIDDNNDNLLFSSLKFGDSKIINYFLKFIDVNTKLIKSSNDIESAIRIAYRNENIELFLLLLKKDSMFPNDFTNEDKENLKLKSKDFKDYMESIENLHKKVETISDEEFEKLLKFRETRKDFDLLSDEVREFYFSLLSHCNQKYCFNVDNISLAHQALKFNKINLFKCLIQYFCKTFGPDEDEAEKLCSKITNLNIENCKKFTHHHLDVLMSQIRVNISTQEPDPLQYETVRKVLNYLNTIDRTRSILKIVAAQSNFKLVFDTTRNDVTNLKINGDQGTLGVFFLNSENIIVGAKYLFEQSIIEEICKPDFKFDENLDVKIAQIIGTFKHELCHYAMLLTFKNRCKPFSLDCDHEFQAIIDECKKKSEKSTNADELRIIGSVFTEYPENVWAAELVVRPAQIYAEFIRKPNILLNFRVHFYKLFKYFDNEVMPKVESSLQIVENLSKIDTEIGFDDLTNELQLTLKNSWIKFQGNFSKISSLINSNEEILRCLKTYQIRTVLGNFNFLKIGEEIEEPKNYIVRSFFQKSTQSKLNFDEISKFANSKKIFIIREGVEEGKTKFLDYAASQIKMHNVDKWILKVDQKLHGNLVKIQNILNFLIENVLELDENSFEANVFEVLFKSGRIVIIWDHYELKDIKEIVSKILKDTNNEQWLAIWNYDENFNIFGEEIVFEFLEMKENEKIYLVSMTERNQREFFLNNH